MRVDEIAKELARIEDEQGRLTARAVVAAASNEASPMHDHFEWDDSVAGNNYREQQARKLIEKVTFIVESETVQIAAVAYVRDPDCAPHEQGYRHVESLSRDEDAARDMLAAEFKRAGALFKRARKLAAAVGLAAEVERLELEVGLLRSRVQEEGRA